VRRNPKGEPVVNARLVVMEGPEWLVVLGVFVDGASDLRAEQLIAAVKLRDPKALKRIPRLFQAELYMGLSQFRIQEHVVE
jgi:hypothetical protein